MTFSEPMEDSPSLFYSPPTPSSFGAGPERLDLLDRTQAEVKESSVPDSGMGVFAKLWIPSGVAATVFTAMLHRNTKEQFDYQMR